MDVENEEYLVDICEVDPEDYKDDIRNLEDENIWKKANPIRMSYKNGADKIRTAWRVAKEIPEKMTVKEILEKKIPARMTVKEIPAKTIRAKMTAKRMKLLPV